MCVSSEHHRTSQRLLHQNKTTQYYRTSQRLLHQNKTTQYYITWSVMLFELTLTFTDKV